MSGHEKLVKRLIQGTKRERAAAVAIEALQRERDELNARSTARAALLDVYKRENAALREDFAHFAPYFEAGVRALCPDPCGERRRLDAARARHKEGM